jgi:hypothetical protein
MHKSQTTQSMYAHIFPKFKLTTTNQKPTRNNVCVRVKYTHTIIQHFFKKKQQQTNKQTKKQTNKNKKNLPA